jgi:trans-aconitate methyltransferase
MVDRTSSVAFDDDDVARAYAHRPPYPPALYDFLLGLPRARRRALDLGCGPGKIAHGLAPHFQHVDAVDPSLPMLHLGDDGRYPNISWIHAPAESAQLAPSYDLITAGASIHWMDHEIIFPRLADILAEGGAMAVLGGDDAYDPPWEAEIQDFNRRWVERLGGTYDHQAYSRALSAYERWMTITGRRTFEALVHQTIEHYLESQHSRATWSRANLGPELTERFDAELRDLLAPHIDGGMLHYTVKTDVAWGVPRRTADNL